MIFRFNEFSVNASSYEFWQAGRRTKAEPQVIDLLIFLIKNRIRCVSKDEIFETIWQGKIVSETTLSSRIKDVRKLLGDDGKTQRYIRTIHGRGFQFVADDVSVQTNEAPSPAEAVDEPDFQRPVTRYAKSGDIHIAYQEFGEGDVTLVFVPGFISNIENYWDGRHMSRWLMSLGKIAKIVMFDKRGTGLSDTVYPLPDVDSRMDDVCAVMDAASIEKAYVMGVSEGGSLASLFAAVHPQRCLGLILYGAFSQFSSWYKTREELQGLFDYIESFWGSGESLPMFAPSAGDDVELKQWWGKFERLGATPGAAIALMRMNSEINIRPILPSIQAPTLVIHRDEDTLIDTDAGRILADEIPNAQYIELAGADHLPWVGGNSDAIIGAISDFVSVGIRSPVPDSTLTTLVSIGPVVQSEADFENHGTPQMIDAHDTAKRIITRFGGRCVNSETHALLGSFDGPVKAVYSACDIAEKLRNSAVQLGVCVHTGEVQIINGRYEGLTLDRAALMQSYCADGQVVISSTVKDLIAGAGLLAKSLGKKPLGRLKEKWHLYTVEKTS